MSEENKDKESNKKSQVEAYCMKCKTKSLMNVEKSEVKHTARGDKALLSGFCAVCSCKMCKIVKVSEVQA